MTLESALSKIPPTSNPLKITFEFPSIENKYLYFKSMVDAPDHILRGMAYLLQNVDVTIFDEEDLEALSKLKYEKLYVPNPVSSDSALILNPDSPQHDLLDGSINVNLSNSDYNYSAAFANSQSLSLYELALFLQ
jgi:hypothetical protein